MLEKDVHLLESAFKKYYFDHFNLIPTPPKISEREFGYKKFNSGMIRHISLKTSDELRLLLITNNPSDVYCSNAYYSFPNLPMNEKDWKEADLIFDLDAKDLNLSCRNEHSCIKCSSCDQINLKQQLCPNCNSTKIESITLTCTNCIDGTKTETNKLIEILENDFNINSKDIQIYFSGNEGFHLHIVNSQYNKLGSRERTELIDYLMFQGAIPETFGMKKPNPNKPKKIKREELLDFGETGWRGRASKQIFGTKTKRSKIITEIIDAGYQVFQKKLEKLSDSLGVKIDPHVTTDIHRVFRLPGSLNSKSGLSKIRCENIDKFNPYEDACNIDDEEIEVIANSPIAFTLKNKKFGPYKNEKTFLPKYAAIYLICKGLATVA